MTIAARAPVTSKLPISIGQNGNRNHTARQNRNHSLSSIGWRRGSGRGGAFVLDCPSPRSFPRSFVTGRGRKSVSPNLCRKCANLHNCSTEGNSAALPRQLLRSSALLPIGLQLPNE